MNNFRWKALDFASLNNSSVSFFKVEKQETAVSKWARARKRAAKVIDHKAVMKTASTFAFFFCYCIICTNFFSVICLLGWKRSVKG
jgi:hypothetical protein